MHAYKLKGSGETVFAAGSAIREMANTSENEPERATARNAGAKTGFAHGNSGLRPNGSSPHPSADAQQKDCSSSADVPSNLRH